MLEAEKERNATTVDDGTESVILKVKTDFVEKQGLKVDSLTDWFW